MRVSSLTSLSADQIGDESILRSIVKMTAICWTRCLYRHPPLANQAWGRWRDCQKDKHYYSTLSLHVPKDWKKRQGICNYIIKACPSCSQSNSTANKTGNLEHLHLYCPPRHLEHVCSHCNAKIEEALLNL